MRAFPAQFTSVQGARHDTAATQRMIEDMKLKNLSTRTINAYVSRVSFFARHFRRSPEYLGRDDVRSYLLQLIQEKKVSWSVYNQTLLRCVTSTRSRLEGKTSWTAFRSQSNPSGSLSFSARTKSPRSSQVSSTSSTAPSS